MAVTSHSKDDHDVINVCSVAVTTDDSYFVTSGANRPIHSSSEDFGPK